MRTLRVLPVVFLLAAAAGGGGCGTSDAGFKLIHVDHLVAMLGSNEGAVTLLDAKPWAHPETPRPRRPAPAARRERTRVPGRRVAGQAPPPGPVFRHSRWRSSTRRIFPLTVFGRLSTNSIARGYL